MRSNGVLRRVLATHRCASHPTVSGTIIRSSMRTATPWSGSSGDNVMAGTTRYSAIFGLKSVTTATPAATSPSSARDPGRTMLPKATAAPSPRASSSVARAAEACPFIAVSEQAPRGPVIPRRPAGPSSEPDHVRRPVVVQPVARVDDQRSARDDAIVVDRGVIRREDDAVDIREDLVGERLRPDRPRVGQRDLGHVRIVI